MVDLETMSTASNAAICSIGAVKFLLDDPTAPADGIFGEPFYTTVDAADCKRLGLDISKDTLAWWSKQPRAVLAMLTKDTKPLATALGAFADWYGPKSLPTWGCGASFDNVILDNAFKAVGRTRPWKYWDDRCYRTMKAMFNLQEHARQGTYHNALDDAMHQTRHLLRIVNG